MSKLAMSRLVRDLLESARPKKGAQIPEAQLHKFFHPNRPIFHQNTILKYNSANFSRSQVSSECFLVVQ